MDIATTRPTGHEGRVGKNTITNLRRFFLALSKITKNYITDGKENIELWLFAR